MFSVHSLWLNHYLSQSGPRAILLRSSNSLEDPVRKKSPFAPGVIKRTKDCPLLFKMPNESRKMNFMLFKCWPSAFQKPCLARCLQHCPPCSGLDQRHAGLWQLLRQHDLRTYYSSYFVLGLEQVCQYSTSILLPARQLRAPTSQESWARSLHSSLSMQTSEIKSIRTATHLEIRHHSVFHILCVPLHPCVRVWSVKLGITNQRPLRLIDPWPNCTQWFIG